MTDTLWHGYLSYLSSLHSPPTTKGIVELRSCFALATLASFASIATAEELPNDDLMLRATVSYYDAANNLQDKFNIVSSDSAIKIEPLNAHGATATTIRDYGAGIAYLIPSSARRYAVADLVPASEVRPVLDFSSDVGYKTAQYQGGLLAKQVCWGAGTRIEVKPAWFSTRKHVWHECRDSSDMLLAREYYSNQLGIVIKVEFPNGSYAIADPVEHETFKLEMFQPPQDFQEVPIEVLLQSSSLSLEQIR
ncbi:hypothetical protein [Allohahella sp. A8]|uniref:hypothetical protein n=1 Tax=Allohahella sp. A8 TaxID=3141461 RepID=UPI003A80374F